MIWNEESDHISWRAWNLLSTSCRVWSVSQLKASAHGAVGTWRGLSSQQDFWRWQRPSSWVNAPCPSNRRKSTKCHMKYASDFSHSVKSCSGRPKRGTHKQSMCVSLLTGAFGEDLTSRLVPSMCWILGCMPEQHWHCSWTIFRSNNQSWETWVLFLSQHFSGIGVASHLPTLGRPEPTKMNNRHNWVIWAYNFPTWAKVPQTNNHYTLLSWSKITWHNNAQKIDGLLQHCHIFFSFPQSMNTAQPVLSRYLHIHEHLSNFAWSTDKAISMTI